MKHGRTWEKGPTLCGKSVKDALRDGDTFTRDIRLLSCQKCIEHPTAREAVRAIPSTYVSGDKNE